MKFILLTVIALLTGTALAADRPNFSGERKINLARSNYGLVPAPADFVRKIVHIEPSIPIVEDQPASSSSRALKTDGQPVAMEMNGTPVQASATWDGAALTVITAVASAGITLKDKMSLSDDGKVLTSKVVIESGQGDVAITVVFDRQ